MSACTPQAAPPVTTAIVTRSPIVRVVRIMFAPRVRTRPGHIGPRFSFGFPLTGDFRTHHYLNGKAESGRHGGPRDRRALPERREPPVLDGRADHRRARPGPRDPDGLSAVRRGEEAGPASVRLLRAHGHRGERLPPRAGPRAVPPRHVPRMQAGLPPRLRSMQEPAVRRISGLAHPASRVSSRRLASSGLLSPPTFGGGAWHARATDPGDGGGGPQGGTAWRPGEREGDR